MFCFKSCLGNDYAACCGKWLVASELQIQNEALSMTVLIQTEAKCRACTAAAVTHQLTFVCSAKNIRMSPLTPDEVIGCTDEGPRGFTQMHSAHGWAPTLRTPHCGTAIWRRARSRKKVKGDNALVHLSPGCGT